jgi:hypothetical protein
VTSYYIYYRVDASRLPALRVEVERLLDAVQRATGVRGRWMRRRDKSDTYMEVYEDVRNEAAFEALLAREAADLRLERHVERFVCA